MYVFIEKNFDALHPLLFDTLIPEVRDSWFDLVDTLAQVEVLLEDRFFLDRIIAYALKING